MILNILDLLYFFKFYQFFYEPLLPSELFVF
jgi:hypothetical protein